MAVHRALTIAVQEGQKRALRYVNNYRTDLPSTVEGFRSFVVELHRLIFKDTALRFAGTFRQDGEPDVYFGSGKNEKRGATPGEIPQRMDALYGATLHGFGDVKLDRRELARLCGRFLEEFFMIHPFHDGNGRVARLILRLMAGHTKRYYFDVFPEDSRSRRRYTQALAYAHRHCHAHSGQVSSGDTVRDPYRFIAEWLEKYILEYEFEELGEIEEREPAWLPEPPDSAEPEEPDFFDGGGEAIKQGQTSDGRS